MEDRLLLDKEIMVDAILSQRASDLTINRYDASVAADNIITRIIAKRAAEGSGAPAVQTGNSRYVTALQSTLNDYYGYTLTSGIISELTKKYEQRLNAEKDPHCT